MRGSRGTWSPERNASLLRMRELGRSYDRILILLNELPGPKITSIAAVSIQYYKLIKLRQLVEAVSKPDLQRTETPADAAPAAAVPGTATGILDVSSLNLPPAAPQPGVFSEATPKLVIPYQDARKWACIHGLCNKYSGLNLKAVNAMRMRIGLQPFVLEGAF
jgi:hypothetical protein